MANIKIIFFVRNDFYSQFGGDTVQVEKTRQFLLQKFNLDIKIICDNGNVNIDEDFDILHVWGINASPFLDKILENAKKNKKKIILSSIYWDVSHSLFLKYFIGPVLNNNLFPFLEKCNKLFEYLIMIPVAAIVPKYRKKTCYICGSKKFKKYRRSSISASDYIIPNSDEEGELLCKDIGLDYKKIENKFIPIPNAVDVSKLNFECTEKILPELNNFVIEAAGIEPLKNQLSIVKALMNKKDIPIVFAGAVRNEKYYNEIKKLAEKRGNVYFTGKIDEKQLFDLYKRAHVHVLASFRESPGLSTLEALICGSQIVVSNEKFCPIKYYKFDKYGFVCNPYDVNSIRNSILNAYNNPKDISLPDDYIKFFSYENAANMTYNVYERVLGEKQ